MTPIEKMRLQTALKELRGTQLSRLWMLVALNRLACLWQMAKWRTRSETRVQSEVAERAKDEVFCCDGEKVVQQAFFHLSRST